LHCATQISVGNVYVNRNIVGASVGVQPFGGHGLSGTGPKAGGPLYLLSLMDTGSRLPEPIASQANHVKPAEKTDQQSDYAVDLKSNQTPSPIPAWPIELEMPGPTGESNVYQLHPRGQMLCMPQTEAGLVVMLDLISQTGNTAQVMPETAKQFASLLADRCFTTAGTDVATVDTQAVLFEGDADHLLALQQALAERDGPILPVLGLRPAQVDAGQRWPMHRLLTEKAVCINTAAAGGNATLMTLG
jgi:RHH-type proline utilization regulon transcriptional repressor/proline dehydrogenase/delta 1-pyrroline-5-carboxylate dehydrogenase